MRHFDVYGASDTASVVDTRYPTELRSTRAFYGESIPAFAQDMYTKMYYTTQLDRPTEAASREKWPLITTERMSQMEGVSSEASKSLNIDPTSDLNLCAPENEDARLELVTFLFFLAGLESRTAEDEPQLHRLRNAMLHYCATHMHEAGAAARVLFEEKEKELRENLRLQIEAAQERLRLEVAQIEAEMAEKTDKKLGAQKRLGSAVASITKSIGLKRLDDEKLEKYRALERAEAAEARTAEVEARLEQTLKERDEVARSGRLWEGEAKAFKEKAEGLSIRLGETEERLQDTEKALTRTNEAAAEAAEAAAAKVEAMTAHEKNLIASHEIQLMRLRGDIKTLRKNTVAKLKHKDELWQAQVDQLRAALSRTGGTLGNTSAAATRLFSIVNTARLKKAMETDQARHPRASEEGGASEELHELRGEVYELKEKLRVAHDEVVEKERMLKEQTRRAVEKQAELRKEMRMKILELTGEKDKDVAAAQALRSKEAYELRQELDMVKEDLIMTEEALVDRIDEAGRLQRETAYSKAQTKMASLLLTAKSFTMRADQGASTSESAAAELAELEEEASRVESMAGALSAMQDQMREADEEMTKLREAKSSMEAAADDRLRKMRESMEAMGDDQVTQIVGLREYVAELEGKAAADAADRMAAEAELARVKEEAREARAEARAMAVAAKAGDAESAREIVESGSASGVVQGQIAKEDAAEAASRAALAFTREHAPRDVREAASLISGGASAAASMDPSMVARALASLDAATSSDVFAELRPEEIGPSIAFAGGLHRLARKTDDGEEAEEDIRSATAEEAYIAAVLPALAAAVSASTSPENAAKALEAAVRTEAAATAAFVRSLPAHFAAGSLAFVPPALTAQMLEKSIAWMRPEDDTAVVDQTAELMGAVTPSVCAAVFEQLSSGVATQISQRLPSQYLARVFAATSATCASAIVARLPEMTLAAEAIALVDPPMHAAAVLTAMKPGEGIEVVRGLVARSANVALRVFAASLVPERMAAIVDAAVAGGAVRDVAAAFFSPGDVKRPVNDVKVAAILSKAKPEAAGAVLCAGASQGNAAHAADVASQMEAPSAALALAHAVSDGKSRAHVVAILSVMRTEDAAALLSRAPNTAAPIILASFPPRIAVAIIATDAVDAEAAVKAVDGLDDSTASALLDALQQKAIFALATKVGKPLQMATRVLSASDRKALADGNAAAAKKKEDEAKIAIAMRVAEDAAKAAEEAKQKLIEASAAGMSPAELAAVARGAAAAAEKQVEAVQALHQDSERMRAELEDRLAAAENEIHMLRAAAEASSTATAVATGNEHASAAPSRAGSAADDDDEFAVERALLNAAIDVPPTTFTPIQLADMGYADHAFSIAQLFGPGGASSTVRTPEEVDDLARKVIDYITATYGVRAMYVEMTYDPENDEDGVDDLDTYDDNTFVLVHSTDSTHPDVCKLSQGDYLPRGEYAAVMYDCANEAREVRTDGQPPGVGAPVTFERSMRAGSSDAAGVAVHIAVPVLSGRALRPGGKAEVLGVLRVAVDATEYDAKRAHAAAVGVLGDGLSFPVSFSVASDLSLAALGLEGAKRRVEELQRREVENIRAMRTSTRPSFASAVSAVKFALVLKNRVEAETTAPPPELAALVRKREALLLQITEHTMTLERFLSAKEKVEAAMSKGRLVNKLMGELRRHKRVARPAAAMCVAVLMLVNATNKGIRELLTPGTYQLPTHENQLLTLWMKLKPFIDPVHVTRNMEACNPKNIGEGVVDAEDKVNIAEAFNACRVLTSDYPYEVAARSGNAYAAMHEWVCVTCNVRREHEALEELTAEVERMEQIVTAAGWAFETAKTHAQE